MPNEVHSLTLKVDSTQIKQGEKDLNSLTNSAGRTEKQTDKVSSSFASLSAILGTVGVGALTAQFIKIADEMKLLDARLKMVTSSTAEYVSQKKELLSISKETYSSVSDITTLYTKLDPALKQLGATTKDVNTITESFAKGLKLGGANTVEAASATLQFAQAMGSGVLRGEEFNAIAEASPKLMKYLADGLGVPQTALRKMAETGELSAGRVSGALLKMTAQINKDFEQIPMTVGMATTNLKTDINIAIEAFDKETGATQHLAEAIAGLSVDMSNLSTDMITFYKSVSKFVNDHNTALKTTASLVGGVAAAYYGFIAGGAVVTGLRNITTAVYALRTAMIALQASSPILLGISVALGVATAAYLAHDDALEAKNYKTINSMDELIKTHEKLRAKRKEISEDKFALDKDQAKDIKAVDTELAKVEARMNAIGKIRSDGVAKAAKEKEELQKQAKALEENAKKLEKPKKEKVAKKTTEQKEAEQLQKDIDKARLDAIQDNADREAKAELELYENMNSARLEKTAEFWEANKAITENGANDMFEKLTYDYTEFYDAISELQSGLEFDKDILSGWNDFGANLDGVAGKIGNVMKVYSDMSKNNQKFIAKDLDLQKKYAKAFLDANGDIEKEKHAQSVFDAEQSKLKQDRKDSEIAAYSSLIGAMGTMFEEGSKGAKVMAIAQGALAIVSAGAGGDPYTVIPRMLAAAITVGQALSSAGISGGSYSDPQSVTNVQTMQADYESQTDAITSRLDRTNELLEAIGKQGSASEVEAQSLLIRYTRELGSLTYDVAQDVVVAGNTELARKQAVGGLALGASAATGLNLGTYAGGSTTATLDTTALAGNIAATLQYISYLSDNIDDIDFSKIDRFERGDVTEWVETALNAIADFATGAIDGVNELKYASNDFKDAFDAITGSALYETEKMVQAFKDVDKLRGENSLADYLQNQINAIDKINLSESDIQTLLLSDVKNLQEQEAILTRITNELGVAFDGGAADALDYLESIQLVSEAMAQSRENAMSFIDSLRSDQESALNMASSLGVDLASNVDQLSELFYRLRDDFDGLTDADVDLLNANKALIESALSATDATVGLKDEQTKLNDYLTSVTKNISTMSSVADSLDSTIDNLRGSALGSKYTLDMFYASMNEAQGLKASNNYEAFSEAIKDAQSYVSALSDSANFGTSKDMRFAEAVAANQFDELQDSALTQVDYLKMIEENTRGQLEILSSSINNLSSSISDSSISSELLQLIQSPTQNSEDAKQVMSAFQSVLGYTPNSSSAGFKYWVNELTSNPSITSDNLNESIARGAGSADLEKSLAWMFKTSGDQGGIKLLSDAYDKGWLTDYAANNLLDEYAIPSAELSDSIKNSYSFDQFKNMINPNALVSFDVGTTNVPYDMVANIHKGETIVPKPFVDGIRRGDMMLGDNSAIIASNNRLISQNNEIIKLLRESRDIQNGTVVQLENIYNVAG